MVKVSIFADILICTYKAASSVCVCVCLLNFSKKCGPISINLFIVYSGVISRGELIKTSGEF